MISRHTHEDDYESLLFSDFNASDAQIGILVCTIE